MFKLVNSSYFPVFIEKPLTNRRGKVSEIITSLNYIRNLQQDQEKTRKTNRNQIEKNLNRKKPVSKQKQPAKANKQKKLFSITETNVDIQEWTCLKRDLEGDSNRLDCL